MLARFTFLLPAASTAVARTLILALRRLRSARRPRRFSFRRTVLVPAERNFTVFRAILRRPSVAATVSVAASSTVTFTLSRPDRAAERGVTRRIFRVVTGALVSFNVAPGATTLTVPVMYECTRHV